jgi:hypothetical protein
MNTYERFPQACLDGIVQDMYGIPKDTRLEFSVRANTLAALIRWGFVPRGDGYYAPGPGPGYSYVMIVWDIMPVHGRRDISIYLDKDM